MEQEQQLELELYSYPTRERLENLILEEASKMCDNLSEALDAEFASPPPLKWNRPDGEETWKGKPNASDLLPQEVVHALDSLNFIKYWDAVVDTEGATISIAWDMEEDTWPDFVSDLEKQKLWESMYPSRRRNNRGGE